MQPFIAQICVEQSPQPIAGIDVRLLRVETQTPGGLCTSEVKRIQVADGDVCRGVGIPFYVHMPRLLTCATVVEAEWSVQFQLKVVVAVGGCEGSKGGEGSSRRERPGLSTTIPLLLVRDA
mmetsp:Transcript_54293/g.172392  ORF Transcript_54293/g.172392 Transcript_54293/m.172392 type:complete len:121 (+) Transcript_54293:1886-2248(+)